MWNGFQLRCEAVDMIRDVAFVAQDEIGLVALGAATFADGAVEASPALLKDHFRDLKERKNTFQTGVLRVKLLIILTLTLMQNGW